MIISVTEEQLRGIIFRAIHKHKDIPVITWKSLIVSKRVQPALTKMGLPRPRYRETITSKLWRFPNGSGWSLIVGKESGTSPHSHLVEKGTGYRIRKPYFGGKNIGRGLGHGIRGKYEFVNYRGSNTYGRPPFSADNKILRTGHVIARRWGETAAAMCTSKVLSEIGASVLEELKSLIEKG